MITKTLTEKRFFEWYEDDVAVTLRNHSGSYGGGSEVLIIYSTDGQQKHNLQQGTSEPNKHECKGS